MSVEGMFFVVTLKLVSMVSLNMFLLQLQTHFQSNHKKTSPLHSYYIPSSNTLQIPSKYPQMPLKYYSNWNGFWVMIIWCLTEVSTLTKSQWSNIKSWNVFFWRLSWRKYQMNIEHSHVLRITFCFPSFFAGSNVPFSSSTFLPPWSNPTHSHQWNATKSIKYWPYWTGIK